MRNSNCRESAAEHGGTRWELCALRSSSAKKRLFFVDNTDGQVDTHEGKNLFHDTDVLLLTLRGVPELSAESVVMMGTGAK